MSSFKAFPIPEGVHRALEALKFETPTPIQAQAIPAALQGRDLIGVAQTGTGKTGAFCIPILTRILSDRDAHALVLVPTRELALQIEEFWLALTRFHPEARCAVLIGGKSMQPQMRAIQARPRFVIATPGRLIDHLENRSIALSRVGILVLDEADRMLDMGFAPQLNRILKQVPKNRQTLFFTATWAPETDALARAHLSNPEKITVGKPSQATHLVVQSLIATDQKRKNETLLEEVNRREGSVLIFARTQHRTDRVARFLDGYGVEVGRIHGGRSQGQRIKALDAFKKGEIRVLVATDIAARGIDVSEIAHVINYDLPQVPEDYIHRIGRTGRAGASGSALSFVTPDDRSQWREIAKLLEKSGSPVPQPSPAASRAT